MFYNVITSAMKHNKNYERLKLTCGAGPIVTDRFVLVIFMPLKTQI